MQNSVHCITVIVHTYIQIIILHHVCMQWTHAPALEESNSTGSDGSGLFFIEGVGIAEDEAVVVSSEG